ncbi:MAG TPA: dihydrofolate reductase family protein [Solirubrobacterales bacterium]|jgi:riboflavin-specific deaminase-like protein
MRRLIPDPGPTTVEEQLQAYRPWEHPHDQRPFVAMNFAVTVDGRASIDGHSGPIGSATDTAMLVGLRTRFDALMIGAGTMRAERYGRPVSDPAKRAEREELGLAGDPLMVIVSATLELPWDAGLFTAGAGRVLIFTTSETEPPETSTEVTVVRRRPALNLDAALRLLHEENGVRALLCEGGPHLHAQLEAGDLVDDLFLTIAPKLAGGEAPRILEGELPSVDPLVLSWLLEEDGELFARYGRT